MTLKIPVRLGRSKPVIQVKEADILKAITDWLAAERIFFIRLNTGAMTAEYKGKKRFVRFCRPGVADILAIPLEAVTSIKCGERTCPTSWDVCHPTWIEVKGPKGIQSEEQKRFQDEVEEEGMTYILARDLNDVISVLKSREV